MKGSNPILNNPYNEPQWHYATDPDGNLNYNDVRKDRRIFTPDIQGIPQKQGAQGSLLEVNDFQESYGEYLVNLLRREVGRWRSESYPGVTRVTRELLHCWFLDPERLVTKQLFFAQREAIESAIWLNEIAPGTNFGSSMLARLQQAREVSTSADYNLPRTAFKMATGSGKTVVMAALILYHYFNRQEYRNDTRFADYFLVVAPGITIRDRLSVLFVDTDTRNPQEIKDYYRQRGLVPKAFESRMGNLNSRLVITNYHAFEPKNIQGNKRSPFDGKIGADGKKQEAREDFSLVMKRLLGRFKTDRRLLILNDEAHHCYLPKSKGRTTDNEEADENERAAVWYTGLAEIGKRYKLAGIYDLSATPYYLQGSGYPPYSLFPWVVSDFGLIEAIESGLVKIPFLPESDNTHELSMPKLRNLYEHVKQDLPKKGQRGQRKADKKEGKKKVEEPPMLPKDVKAALDQFYSHYETYDKGIRKQGESRSDIFTTPPVFIAVCNNTTVSKEVYKFIAGYEERDEEGNISKITPGHYEFFSNYDKGTTRPRVKPPTLLIDSDALENSGQVNEDFRHVFASEIQEFKREYARLHGQGSAENITDAEILREVVNTVGQPGKLGAHIRCVVSVSMLTEGWDANTVTHIMGLRAFGSQLLCEQVAGRALRRRNYFLQGYDKDGNPTSDKRKTVIEKFPPEYAHIIGVPFKIFKGGETEAPVAPDYTRIYAIHEREQTYEITFPNLNGYRVEHLESELQYDFTAVSNFEIDGTRLPVETHLGSAVSEEQVRMAADNVLRKRDQEIVFWLTRELLRRKFCDDDGNPEFHKFRSLKTIAEHWYDHKIKLVNLAEPEKRRFIYFYDSATICDHIALGINPHVNTSEFVRPVFNFYNRTGSTKYVNGHTSKPREKLFATTKSHVNYVVADTDSWEQIASKTLEELPEVISYVKNAFLGFSIPYVSDGKDKRYFPDFIARVKRADGSTFNLIIEITGFNKEKEDKRWYVQHRWLPAVNAVRDKYGWDEWRFVEIANDIREIKAQLKAFIR